MKTARLLLMVFAALAALTLASTEAGAQTKKQQKRERAALQYRANLTAGTINCMNPEYSPDDHAVLVMPRDLALRGALGQTILLPPGNHSLQFIDKGLIERRFGVQATWLDKYVTAECVLEAGKYYTVEYNTKAVDFILETATIVELTNEGQLATARADATAIRQQATLYFEYMKANPQELNGTFACRMPNIRFTFDGERYSQESNMLGIRNYISGRYWYDGRSVIMYTDTAGIKRENAEATEIIVPQLMYYTMDEGDWVISTKPIVNIRRKTTRYKRQ